MSILDITKPAPKTDDPAGYRTAGKRRSGSNHPYWFLVPALVVLFVFFFLPIFPIARYRVVPISGGYRFVGKGPLRPVDKWHIAASLGLLAYMLLHA